MAIGDENDPVCGRCGCYRSAHGEGERCEPVGWSFISEAEQIELVRVRLFGNLAHYRQRCISERDDACAVVRFFTRRQ
jgi:hypothetical protein